MARARFSDRGRTARYSEISARRSFWCRGRGDLGRQRPVATSHTPYVNRFAAGARPVSEAGFLQSVSKAFGGDIQMIDSSSIPCIILRAPSRSADVACEFNRATTVIASEPGKIVSRLNPSPLTTSGGRARRCSTRSASTRTGSRSAWRMSTAGGLASLQRRRIFACPDPNAPGMGRHDRRLGGRQETSSRALAFGSPRCGLRSGGVNVQVRLKCPHLREIEMAV